MTYAGQRTILDADSHIMELADFLDAYIDEDQRDRLRRRGMDALAPVLEKAADKAASRRADPAKAAEARSACGRTRAGRPWAPSTPTSGGGRSTSWGSTDS